MSNPNLKAMTQAELLKYLDEDFMPRLLPKLANVQNIESENARLKAEVERIRKFNDEALAHIAKEERKSRERLDMAQADVERLIKAGDNLITALDKRDDVFDNSDKRQAIADWNAAKDASQA